MLIALLPSEIARLVLNYLEDEGYTKTYAQFLKECTELKECRFYLDRGIALPKTIHGKTLFDYLSFDPDKIDEKTSQKDSPRTANTKVIQDTSIKQTNQIKIPTNEDSESLSKIKISCSPQKNRLLIGKNVEKIPELSVSTLERQLGSIISDASNYLKQQEEQEANLIQSTNTVFTQPIIIDQTTMNSLASSQQLISIGSELPPNLNGSCLAPIQAASSFKIPQNIILPQQKEPSNPNQKRIAIKPKKSETEQEPVKKIIINQDDGQRKRGPKRLIGPKNKIKRTQVIRVKPFISEIIGERPIDKANNKLSIVNKEHNENRMLENEVESHELYELLGIKNSFVSDKLDDRDTFLKKAMREVTNSQSETSINEKQLIIDETTKNTTIDLASISTALNDWFNTSNQSSV